MTKRHRNIELKATLRNPTTAREIAESLTDRAVELQSQTDTYFHCPHGRLKLREINGSRATLIWYYRADRAAAKPSDYQLVEIADAAGLLAALTTALGVRTAVRKLRQIYWCRNVRIHIDEVESLGSFLEFEAVLSDLADEATSRELVDALARQFDLSPDDLLDRSYSDMLAAQDNDYRK